MHIQQTLLFTWAGLFCVSSGAIAATEPHPSVDPAMAAAPVSSQITSGGLNQNIPLSGSRTQLPLPTAFVAQAAPAASEQITPSLDPQRPDLKPLPQTLPPSQPPPRLEVEPSTPTPTPPSVETRVQVRQVKILGSTVFSPAELERVVQPFLGKDLNFEQLLDIRSAITTLYTNRGYTTSGAFLPAQDVSSGVITIQVVEGALERLDINGLRWLRHGYVRDRIRRAAHTPLNIKRLETSLQLLQLDPLFNSVQAELKAGTSPGQSVLALKLQEAFPLLGGLTVENRDSPSVGSIRKTLSLGTLDLLGWGDRLTVDAGYTEGIESYNVGYDLPVNAKDGTLSLRYSFSNSRIVEPPFSALDIFGRTETYSLGFRQPLIHTPTTEFALSLSGDWRESRTYLLGNIPFSFSLGPENGRSRISVLRVSQDWTQRSPRRVLSARSQFSLGLDAFDATVNATGVDGRFFSWVGQFQWVQALGGNTIAIARVATQLTPDSLLPLEQFSIGGVDTVRGYRQNEQVADNGITGSLEVRLPIVNDPNGLGLLHLVPFFDVGTIWNSNGVAISHPTLASIGLGLRWQYDRHLSARVDWGFPLTDTGRSGHSLQDHGVFFSVVFNPF